MSSLPPSVEQPFYSIGAESDGIELLLVDDDPGFVELTQSFLKREGSGFVITCETGPYNALERIRSEDTAVDCIVSDYRMPQMNGLELLDAVREYDTEIPFILFTGQGSEEIAADAIAAGVTDYLQKGGTEAYSILSNRIENAVESYHRQQELDRIHERFQTLIENGSDIVGVLNTDRTIQYVSPSVNQILGFDPRELTGEDAATFIHPDDDHRVDKQFGTLHSDTDIADATARYRCRNAEGEWQWLETVVTDERSSRLDGYVVNARDVTTQVHQRRELQRQNELFEATQQLRVRWRMEVRFTDGDIPLE